MTANGVDASFSGRLLCNNPYHDVAGVLEFWAMEISMDVVHIKVWFGL